MARRYIGGSKARSSDVFNYLLPEEMITPDLIHNQQVSERLLRSEYTRLRDITQKRIKRMEGKPEASETLNEMKGSLPTIKELKQSTTNPDDFRRSLVQGIMKEARFLTARRGSLSGIRNVNKQISSTLKERSGGKINVAEKDLQDFGRFMNAMKRAYHYKGRRNGRGARDLASDQFAQMWQTLNEKGNITEKAYKEALKEVLANLEGSEEAPRINSTRRKESTRASSYFAQEKMSRRSRRRR